eukprot:gene29154-32373_t
MAQESDSFIAFNRLLEAPHTSNGSIRKVCLAVEDCIVNNRDNLRGFFDKCFPSLLKRVFGYDDFETSWLNLVTKPGKEEDARALVALLSPKGKLFAAMQSADADQLIQFIFPVERLPAHTQELLRRVAGRLELTHWPQYKDRVVRDSSGHIQVFLNVFEYYMFWTAFYVLRGGRSCDSYTGSGSRSRGGGSGSSGSGSGRPLQHWGQSYMSDISRMGSKLISGLSQHPGVPLQSHPYYTLLRMYLAHSIPRSNAGGSDNSQLRKKTTSASMSSTWAQGPVYSSSTSTKASPGEVLLNVLLEFWLTDNAEPLPSDKGAVERSGRAGGASGTSSMTASAKKGEMPTPSGAASPPPVGNSSMLGGAAGAGGTGGNETLSSSASASDSLSSVRVLSFQPPSEELIEALDLLVRYIHIQEPPSSSRSSQRVHPSQLPTRTTVEPKPAQGREPWLPEVHVRTTTQLPPPSSRNGGGQRAFTQWPLASSAPLTPVVNLWLSIIAPWAVASSGSASSLASPARANMGHSQHTARQGGGVTSALSGGRSLSSPNQGRYSSEWRSHVLSHLPFYTLLIPHFVELTHARMQAYKGDAAASDMFMLLSVLSDAPELLQEIKAAERAYNNFIKSPLRRPDGPYADWLPWLVDQALDFESAAVAGAPTNPPMQVDTTYRLFTSDSHSAAYYAVAVLRASALQLKPYLKLRLLINGVADIIAQAVAKAQAQAQAAAVAF